MFKKANLIYILIISVFLFLTINSFSGSKQKIRKINTAEKKQFKKLLGTINEKQSFFLSFKNFNKVYFVPVIKDENNYYFCLVKNKKIYYRLSKPKMTWALDQIKSVAFLDMNFDGYKDITIISEQMTGIGPTAAQTFTVTWLYLNDKKKGFQLYPPKELEKLTSVKALYQYMKKKYKK